MNELPLAGVRVLDFTRILSGPYGTLLLAELGAEVIKIEQPETGDDTRSWGPPFLDEEESTSAYFGALNRGKRSLALDLREDVDYETFRALVPTADIVVDNFRPGVARRLRIDRESIQELNPAIVTCSISGFGTEPALEHLPGTEIVVEAMSGLMSVTGDRDGEPVRFGIAMTDIATGLTATTRILAELLAARASGTGRHIDVSLYGVAIGCLGTLVAGSSVTGETPQRWGSHHPSIVPYGGFPTSDGSVITGCINDRQWPVFCEVIGDPQLRNVFEYTTNASRVRHRVQVEDRISIATRMWTTQELVEALLAKGLLAAPIRTVTEMMSDPVTETLGLITADGAHPQLRTTRVSCTNVYGADQRVVPELGEANAEFEERK